MDSLVVDRGLLTTLIAVASVPWRRRLGTFEGGGGGGLGFGANEVFPALAWLEAVPLNSRLLVEVLGMEALGLVFLTITLSDCRRRVPRFVLLAAVPLT